MTPAHPDTIMIRLQQNSLFGDDLSCSLRIPLLHPAGGASSDARRRTRRLPLLEITLLIHGHQSDVRKTVES